ncbi:MAG: hypothetical protein ACOCQR_00180 [bacterium]
MIIQNLEDITRKRFTLKEILMNITIKKEIWNPRHFIRSLDIANI